MKIVTPNELLSVNKPQLHRCETTGSYPPARIIWLLGGKPITNAVVTVRTNRVSSLYFFVYVNKSSLFKKNRFHAIFEREFTEMM